MLLTYVDVIYRASTGVRPMRGCRILFHADLLRSNSSSTILWSVAGELGRCSRTLAFRTFAAVALRISAWSVRSLSAGRLATLLDARRVYPLGVQTYWPGETCCHLQVVAVREPFLSTGGGFLSHVLTILRPCSPACTPVLALASIKTSWWTLAGTALSVLPKSVQSMSLSSLVLTCVWEHRRLQTRQRVSLKRRSET